MGGVCARPCSGSAAAVHAADALQPAQRAAAPAGGVVAVQPGPPQPALLRSPGAFPVRLSPVIRLNHARRPLQRCSSQHCHCLVWELALSSLCLHGVQAFGRLAA